MATIVKTLSTKVGKDGKSELYFRITNGRALRLRFKTGLFVPIKRWSDKKQNIIIPASLIGSEYKDLLRLKESADNYTSIILALLKEYKPEELTADLIKRVIDACIENNITISGLSRKDIDELIAVKQDDITFSIYERCEEYLTENNFSNDHTRAFRVLIRDIARYELYRQHTDKDFEFDIDTISPKDIIDFRKFLINEYTIAKKHPKLFNSIYEEIPLIANIKRKSPELTERGQNTIVKLMKKLHAFFVWLRRKEYTKNDPFIGITIGGEHYEEPYYLTKEERDLIASYPIRSKSLQIQRDIFIFHCLVGCRIGDLYNLTEANIQGDVLKYKPHKTKDNNTSKAASVPLTSYALHLIDKYKEQDKRGRLFPFISEQKYREAIKAILTECGITRNVAVRNQVTGETEYHPINEIASSHIARKTFVGIAYKETKDPSIIASMSGHVEGSKAFGRYRSIDTADQREVISKTDVSTTNIPEPSVSKENLAQLLNQLSDEDVRQLLSTRLGDVSFHIKQ